MRLKFYKVADLDKNLKATIHKTGKLGFTADAAKKLDLANNKSVNIGANEDDPLDTNLYMVLYPDFETGDFKVIKAGQYFYINTKVLFDNLKIPYTKETVSFDLEFKEYDGMGVYSLKKRNKTKKDKADEE